MKKSVSQFSFLLIAFLFFTVPVAHSQVEFIKRAIELDFDGACSVHTGDINGDGFPDVLSTAWNAGSVGWWASDGGYPPTFSRMIIDSNFNGASYVYPGDIDGDSDIDLVASAWYADRITVWWNNGDHPVTWTKQGLDSSFNHAHEARIADIDGTGGLDVVAVSAQHNEVSWWRNDGGTPVQWTKYVISSEVYGARSVFPVDLDDDGDTDLLCAGLDDDDVSVFFNDGGNPIVWTEQIIDGDFNGAHWVFSMDMDNDADMDVLAAGYMAADIAIWYNEGGTPLQWTKFILDANFPGALSVVAAKIDEDDFPDVVAGGDAAADVRVYYNDGTGAPNFTRIILDPAFYGVWPVWMSDLDNDTDIDILATTSTNHDIYWWDNQIVTTGTPEPADGNHRSLLERIYPNPFQQTTCLSVKIPHNTPLRIELFSASGYLVRTLFDGFSDSGIHGFSWDGNDDKGRDLPGGIYLCRITTPAKVTSAQIRKVK